jgi:S-adenosylmethionine synthetase
MRSDFLFTSESVTEGHPDKLCDQISDAIVDRFLQQDPLSSIVAECAVSQSIVFLAVQFASTAVVDVPYVAREIINEVGYRDEFFSGQSCTALSSLQELPLEEALRFDEMALDDDKIERIKVQNQTNAFGYACNQSPVLMPLPIVLAHRLARRIGKVRFTKVLPYLTPDAKTQVGVEYKNGQPHRIQTITIQTCLKKGADVKNLYDDIKETVIDGSFEGEELRPDRDTNIDIRSDYSYSGCGPAVHSGLTGRKNAIDTYGEYARHSGAALSGKDPRRVDRIGAYAARYAAKNVVAAGIAQECEVQLSYSVGRSRPVSILVETFGTGRISDERIVKILTTHFEFRPAGILKQFKLRHLPRMVKGGFFKKLAAYGHVGRADIGLPWELTDKVDILRDAVSATISSQGAPGG